MNAEHQVQAAERLRRRAIVQAALSFLFLVVGVIFSGTGFGPSLVAAGVVAGVGASICNGICDLILSRGH